MSPDPSHLDLLALARRVRDAAVHGGADALHRELSQLHAALVQHVHAEADRFDGLSGATADVARNGQRRLLRLLSDVLFSEADTSDTERCNCLVRAAEIELALRRQAKVERVLFGHITHAFEEGSA